MAILGRGGPLYGMGRPLASPACRALHHDRQRLSAWARSAGSAHGTYPKSRPVRRLNSSCAEPDDGVDVVQPVEHRGDHSPFREPIAEPHRPRRVIGAGLFSPLKLLGAMLHPRPMATSRTPHHLHRPSVTAVPLPGGFNRPPRPAGPTVVVTHLIEIGYLRAPRRARTKSRPTLIEVVPSAIPNRWPRPALHPRPAVAAMWKCVGMEIAVCTPRGIEPESSVVKEGVSCKQ